VTVVTRPFSWLPPLKHAVEREREFSRGKLKRVFSRRGRFAPGMRRDPCVVGYICTCPVGASSYPGIIRVIQANVKRRIVGHQQNRAFDRPSPADVEKIYQAGDNATTNIRSCPGQRTGAWPCQGYWLRKPLPLHSGW